MEIDGDANGYNPKQKEMDEDKEKRNQPVVLQIRNLSFKLSKDELASHMASHLESVGLGSAHKHINYAILHHKNTGTSKIYYQNGQHKYNYKVPNARQ